MLEKGLIKKILICRTYKIISMTINVTCTFHHGFKYTIKVYNWEKSENG